MRMYIHEYDPHPPGVGINGASCCLHKSSGEMRTSLNTAFNLIGLKRTVSQSCILRGCFAHPPARSGTAQSRCRGMEYHGWLWWAGHETVRVCPPLVWKLSVSVRVGALQLSSYPTDISINMQSARSHMHGMRPNTLNTSNQNGGHECTPAPASTTLTKSTSPRPEGRAVLQAALCRLAVSL